MQFGLASRLLREFPRLPVVDVAVGKIGQCHDLAHGARELARLVEIADAARRGREFALDIGPEIRLAEPVLEAFGDEPHAPAGDVHVLPHQVAVHSRHEVIEVQVDVLHGRTELGRVVVAQPLRIQLEVEVTLRGDEGAAALRHLLAIDGEKPVGEDPGGGSIAGELQGGRPKERMEIEDVLADEMNHLRAGGLRRRGVGESREVDRRPAIAQVAEAAQVADGRIEPDVKILAGRVRDLEAEVGRVARDVPIVEAGVEPFANLVAGLGLIQEMAAVGQRCLGVIAQERLAFAELEEVVFRAAAHRRGAGHDRVGVLQVGGAVGCPAHLARIAILVFGATVRTFALDETIGQEEFLHRVVELFHRARGDEFRVVAQLAVDVVRNGTGVFVVGRAVVVEFDQEAVEIRLVLAPYPGDKLLRGDALLVGAQHDRRAMGVVGADVMHLMPAHLLEAHPDIGLDVLDQMAEVDAAVGVRQGGGDQQAA